MRESQSLCILASSVLLHKGNLRRNKNKLFEGSHQIRFFLVEKIQSFKYWPNLANSFISEFDNLEQEGLRLLIYERLRIYKNFGYWRGFLGAIAN